MNVFRAFSLGTRWIQQSPVEIFAEDIARFRVLLAVPVEEDPFEALAADRAPDLRALRLFNGTVYRWNRACYGLTDGKPHLRIENRIFPAGPTVIDEIANAALFLGLISGMPEQCSDVTAVMEFSHAESNFLAAAQHGLDRPLPGFGVSGCKPASSSSRSCFRLLAPGWHRWDWCAKISTDTWE